MKNIIQFPLRKPFSGYMFGLEAECEICGTTMFKAIKEQILSNNYEFVINNYYKKDSIWPKFGVGARGGIRFNKSKNLVVVFSDAKPQKSIDDAGRNIYEDGYDSKKKLFRYTGQGQEGNQEFTRGNKWLLESFVCRYTNQSIAGMDPLLWIFARLQGNLRYPPLSFH